MDARLIRCMDVDLGLLPFVISPEETSVPAGIVCFDITAVGSMHELLLIKTDDTAADLIAASVVGQSSDESGWDIRIDTGDIMAGDMFHGVANLEEGHYVMLCNMAGHLHLGMAVDFTVSEAVDTFTFRKFPSRGTVTYGPVSLHVKKGLNFGTGSVTNDDGDALATWRLHNGLFTVTLL